MRKHHTNTVNFFYVQFFLSFYAPSHTDFYKFHIASLNSDSQLLLSRRSAHHVSRALFNKKKLRPWFLIFQQNEKNAYVSLSRYAVSMRPYSKTEPANETFWKHVQKNSLWKCSPGIQKIFSGIWKIISGTRKLLLKSALETWCALLRLKRGLLSEFKDAIWNL